MLQIRLDRLRSTEERCRLGLAQLVDGSLTQDRYLDLMQRQIEAQEDWESMHRKYFASRGPIEPTA